jgi:hypothetical protein
VLFFVASLYYCWKELRAAEKIHRANISLQSAEYLAAAFTLRMAVVSYAVFFCFEHIAYDPFYPAVAGIIVAFSRASRGLTSAAVPGPAPQQHFARPAFVKPPTRAAR